VQFLHQLKQFAAKIEPNLMHNLHHCGILFKYGAKKVQALKCTDV
jgi:hypothetical protein